VIGVGRVKTPTLAIVCKRELEIRHFVPQAYFEVVATAVVEAGQFRMRHAPEPRLLKREDADAVAVLAEGFAGPLTVKVQDKRQGPPRLHDLPSLQRLCGSRFGWSASKTLEVAQELYDGQGKKVITYPRAETRYLPESLIPDAPGIVAALRAGQTFGTIPMPEPLAMRRGAGGTFHDKGLGGASHHAVIPNANRKPARRLVARCTERRRDIETNEGAVADYGERHRAGRAHLDLKGRGHGQSAGERTHEQAPADALAAPRRPPRASGQGCSAGQTLWPPGNPVRGVAPLVSDTPPAEPPKPTEIRAAACACSAMTSAWSGVIPACGRNGTVSAANACPRWSMTG